MDWKPVNDKNNKPEIGKLYFVTIWKSGFSDDDIRVVTIGSINYSPFKKKNEWDHDDRMIAYAELPEPYNK